MPSRLIKESILTSPNLNSLSDLAERHFYRLLVISDDWGCFESTPAVVRGLCYPLKDSVAKEDVALWQKELEDKNIIKSWICNDRAYSQFVTFDKHNSLNEQHQPQTPAPPWALNDKNFDTRLASDTLQAFEKISVAVADSVASGKKPTYRQIQEKTKCSMSTVAKYFKQTKITNDYSIATPDATPNATPLQFAIDATHKIPNPNPNPNPNHIHNPNNIVDVAESVAEKDDSFILPDWVDKNAWESFMEVRKKKKAVQTNHAKGLLILELENLRKQGFNPLDVLNQSIVNSWKGVFKINQSSFGGNGHKPNKIGEQDEQNAITKFKW
jgi:hypothetical protein